MNDEQAKSLTQERFAKARALIPEHVDETTATTFLLALILIARRLHPEAREADIILMLADVITPSIFLVFGVEQLEKEEA